MMRDERAMRAFCRHARQLADASALFCDHMLR